jgi:glutamate transport system substrate-binding protein
MRLTHTFRLAAVAAALALAATACGGGGESQLGSDAPEPSVAEDVTFEAGTTMAALAEADAIRVGTKFDQPLFGATGLSDQPEGFDVEIAKIIAGRLGIEPDKITFSEAPSAIREEVLEQDRVDMVVATYTINDRRKERISFAGPYYVAGQDLMVAADNTTITGPDSLREANARVCSVSGSTPSETIKQYVDEANITLFDVYSKCADALRTGQVDAVTTDNVILLGLIDQSQGAFKLVGEPFTEEPYGIGLEKGDDEFRTFINDVLEQSFEDGSWAEAWDRTAGAISGQEAPEPPTIDRY